jgi:putative heme-binding domain-containing protein
VELVRAAEPAKEGSWISLAKDPEGRLLLGAERHEPVSRLTIEEGRVTRAEILDLPLSEVMGMLCAFDSLYLNARGQSPDGHEIFGLYRCRSTHADSHYDKVELLREWPGGTGDHGAHAIRLSPDGRQLIVLCGNFVELPADLEPTSPHRHYAEDHVLPRAVDAVSSGDRPPPGGFIARMDPDGRHCELLAAGMRNTYDIACNHDGELFGFDSDKENDYGLPWYRPIRVIHLVSGGDYGFRDGSGKWPEYYADSLPAALNVGIGSPTGIVFGEGAKFPARYQRALFAEDWTYGRLLAVHLSPDGASYGGAWEDFLTPKSLHATTGKTPLNLTGIVVGQDGALYFTIGGRHTEGALYRITYTGPEPSDPADLHEARGEEARALRQTLGAFAGRTDPAAVEKAWPQLSSLDRFLQYSARIALESQPIESWKSRALAETNPRAALTGLLALARLGGTESQADLFKALARFPLARLESESEQLEKLRVIEVSLSRQGKPSADLAAPLLAELDPLYPAKSLPLNRELCQILLALDAPGAIARSLQLAAAAPTQEEQFTYIFHLRNIASGWTPELRRQYFQWWALPRANALHPDGLLRWFAEAGRDYNNGANFDSSLIKTRQTAMSGLTEPELAALRPVLDSWAEPLATLHPPKKPHAFVQDWKMADLEPDLGRVGHGRSFTKGQEALYAAKCLLCHRIGEEGGSIGPELTAIASRFSRRDILESILEPSKVVSEQYANTDLILKNGDPLTGRIVSETADRLVLRPSMLAPEMQEIRKSGLKSRSVSPISPMPPALLDLLTKDEILDLLAYLESGGRRDGAPFQK